MQQFICAISSATTTEIAPAIPGYAIKVMQFELENKHATTDTDITFKSATTAIGGVFTIKAAGGSYGRSYSGVPYYQTAKGEALNLTTSAAGNIVGQIQYIYD